MGKKYYWRSNIEESRFGEMYGISCSDFVNEENKEAWSRFISDKIGGLEVIYDSEGNETERINLDPSTGNLGCVVPARAWHTVEVLEPSVIYEAKDGKYSEDGSETLDEYKAKIAQSPSQSSAPESCLGDLKSQITYLIGMERQSGSMDTISPLYVSRMLNVPFEDVEKCMKEMGV